MSTASIQTYLPKDYIADTKDFNVVKSVHVQAEWPGDPVEETKWLIALKDTNEQGHPHSIVAYCDLSSPTANDVLTRHKEAGKLVGIRQLLNYHSPVRKDLNLAPHDNYLTDKDWLDGVGLLGQHNISFDLHILPHQHKRGAEVAKKYPNITFIVDHCGLPYERDDAAMATWKEGLAALASCPNTVVKVSAMFGIDPQWTKESVLDITQTVVSTFGIDRCMFASNFPVDKINVSFSQLMDAHCELTKGFTEDEKKSYFSGLASKVYQVE